MRGLRRDGLFTIVLLVVLSSAVVNFSMAKESPCETPDDIGLFEPIDLDLSPVLVKSRPKIESRLGDLIDEMTSRGKGSQGVRVIIELEYYDDGIRESLESDGVEIETSYENLLQVIVPPGQIKKLSERDYVQIIRTPLVPYLSESEGVGVMSADVLHGLSITGDGVKVAILDLGFRGYTSLLGTELPSSVVNMSFSAAGGIEASNLPEDSAIHGTACAEVVHDVAPGALLYLVNFDTSVEFLNAVDWLIAQGVDVISLSVGWVNAGPYDGTGYICDAVNNARSNGILVTVSAGNQAQKHYQGTYQSTDGDEWHDFAPDDEAIQIYAESGEQVLVFLSWSADWSTNEDYDLYLYRLLPNGKTIVVAGSLTDQAGSASAPVEGLSYLVTSSGTYLIAVYEYSTSTDWDIELFSFTHTFQTHNVPESSLLIPADATGAITLGATYWEDDVIEPFSSRGPTNDGRVKPDLTAPDGVTSTVYGSFFGTSSSAPHAAGVAALLLVNNSISPEIIQGALEANALSLGDPGKDNVYGSGRIDVLRSALDMGLIPPDVNTTVQLTSMDPNLTAPTGSYRWLDVADQEYGSGYREAYDYLQAEINVTYNVVGDTFKGALVARNLKPNFAYQVKLVGTPGTPENELIGLAGRWWQEEWNGSAWDNGWNLNDKGNGSSPNPNDLVYFSTKDILNATSPTGYHYRYTGYLVFDYFITDSTGNATLDFETGSIYHVLWKTTQRSHTADDGPIKTTSFDPDPSQPAYDTDYSPSNVSIFGEWERLPIGQVHPNPGIYSCQIVLTEESFHGSGGTYSGNWAGAMSSIINFKITRARTEINFNFDSGSIGTYAINGTEIEFTLNTETLVNTGQYYTYWTNFKVSNILGKEVTFKITNADDVPFLSTTTEEAHMVYSYDATNWNRLTTHSYSDGVYTFTETFNGGNEVQIATFFPFSYTEMQNYIEVVNASQYVNATILGYSEEGRDIELLKITNSTIPDDNKEVIYIIGRQHAHETASSHMLKGIIDFLISGDPDAGRMRDTFVWYIVPMVNPDGVYLGKSRATSENRDPNRDWHPDNHESVEIDVVRVDIIDKNNISGIDFFIDWHSQMSDEGWYNFVYSSTGNTFFSILSSWTDFDVEKPSNTYSYSITSCTAGGFVKNDILYDPFFTFEPTPHLDNWTIATLEMEGVNTAYAIDEYFNFIEPTGNFLADSDLEASVDSVDLRLNNATVQDWYESLGVNQTLLTLNTTDVAGNAGKKAGFSENATGNAYLSQEFSTPQTGVFTAQWDILVDTIANISGNPDRAGFMLIGDDSLGTNGPNSEDAERFVYMAFNKTGGATSGTMDLVVRDRDDGWEAFTIIASGLNLDQWYTIKVELDIAAGTYDVYVDGDFKATVTSRVVKTNVTAISFAQWDDGAGAFLVDNVYSPAFEWYTLTVNIVGNGQVDLDPDQVTYQQSTLVELTAVADSGWDFSEWSGDLVGSTSPDTVTMDGDKNVTATFVLGNVAPVVSDPEPADSATGVPVSTGLLNFTLGDANGDLMDYYVSTDPDVGSDSAFGVTDGSYSLSVTGLAYDTECTWWVNVTDGLEWMNASYIFTSEPVPNANPSVDYIRSWGYPGARLDPAGTIARGGAVKMYTKVSDTETASSALTVSISYMPQGGSWTTEPATYYAPLDYWYYTWTIPGDADLDLYDVKVDVSDGDGGSASSTETGEYEVIVGSADPSVEYIRAWGYPGARLDPAGTIARGGAVKMYTKVSDTETASSELTVYINYKQQGAGSWANVSTAYYAALDYWYYEWTIPGGAELGLYDVRVQVWDADTGFTEVTETGEFEVTAGDSNPSVVYIGAWGYPGGRLDPAGTIAQGDKVKIYTKVSDVETASSALTVSISYMPQGGSWTTESTTYYAALDYWYYEWTIPMDADLGLYDVGVAVSDPDGGASTVTELGEFTVTE